MQVPPNGLVIYTGTVMTDDGKEKKLNIDFEPFKPINTSLYLCDNKFHTEALNELLESDSKYVMGPLDARCATAAVHACSVVGHGGGHSDQAALIPQVRLHCDGRQREPIWDAERQHARGDAQVHGGPAKEARARRAVCAALRAPAPGEAPQLCAQGATRCWRLCVEALEQGACSRVLMFPCFIPGVWSAGQAGHFTKAVLRGDIIYRWQRRRCSTS